MPDSTEPNPEAKPGPNPESVHPAPSAGGSAEQQLPVFVMTDQPTECPQCQHRTDHVDLDDGQQRHHCDHCGFAFIMAQDFDGEEQCEVCRDFAPNAQLEKTSGVCATCVSHGWRWSAERDDYVRGAA